jgi:hypothetical protein
MRSRILAAFAAALLVFGMASLAAGGAPGGPRESQKQGENEEVLATLATGQVEIYVGRDGVAIGVLGNAFEPGSHPPLVVSVGMDRMAVLLGAVDWFYPASQRHVRLDAELPRLVATSAAGRPRLGAAPAEDVGTIGLGFLEPLRKLAAGLHAPVELPDRTPLVAVVLVDYKHSEGAAVRELDFKLEQQPLRGNFYQTLVDRPESLALYPPAHKGHADAIDLSYPPGSSASIASLLAKNDPRLAHAATATPAGARVAKLVEQGETRKAPATQLVEFLRVALSTLARPGTPAAVALLNQNGVAWVLPPPETEQPREREAGEKPRPAGAPTLRKPPPN